MSKADFSVRAALREATWASHQRLEKRLDVQQRFSDPAAYSQHLQDMWGFCAGLEQRIAPELFIVALADYPARRKLPLLERDLAALGLSPQAIESLPICDRLSKCADTATALGCLYVLEGATLGGRTLAPVVQRRLGFDSQHGAAFLASYGEQVHAMWHSFCAALESWCCDSGRCARAIAAADGTFRELEHWLCRGPA